MPSLQPVVPTCVDIQLLENTKIQLNDDYQTMLEGYNYFWPTKGLDKWRYVCQQLVRSSQYLVNRKPDNWGSTVPTFVLKILNQGEQKIRDLCLTCGLGDFLCPWEMKSWHFTRKLAFSLCKRITFWEEWVKQQDKGTAFISLSGSSAFCVVRGRGGGLSVFW